ncbi:hypothetical protein F9C07_2144697 [Aspergillus flavus]|uniref:Uncharacterized protein n=1 Tax=Aspergillus flavus (strain ATCC 200026 / FGSC A1120 / IAM 13836 / NRRL 3357 / JCM 12722 / SRRC 167) TaxID=332952 RepID=A0A7U2R0G0_ASPFN|nr:hypothetical protein F9C07_2144697 [Aspergillus flavus]
MTSMRVPRKKQERKISLLMHYVDDVFPHQFPIYHSHFGGRRMAVTLALFNEIGLLRYAMPRSTAQGEMLRYGPARVGLFLPRGETPILYTDAARDTTAFTAIESRM